MRSCPFCYWCSWTVCCRTITCQKQIRSVHFLLAVAASNLPGIKCTIVQPFYLSDWPISIFCMTDMCSIDKKCLIMVAWIGITLGKVVKRHPLWKKFPEETRHGGSLKEEWQSYLILESWILKENHISTKIKFLEETGHTDIVARRLEGEWQI